MGLFGGSGAGPRCGVIDWRLLWMGLMLAVAGCASMHESPDFERHRLSQLVVPYDRTDIYYFDVTFSPAYPDDDASAEAVRMGWLDSYMQTRGLCPSGFEMLARRSFDFLEDNPARHDVRYEVACKAAPAAPS
jgi:hypothetical protein